MVVASLVQNRGSEGAEPATGRRAGAGGQAKKGTQEPGPLLKALRGGGGGGPQGGSGCAQSKVKC